MYLQLKIQYDGNGLSEKTVDAVVAVLASNDGTATITVKSPEKELMVADDLTIKLEEKGFYPKIMESESLERKFIIYF